MIKIDIISGFLGAGKTTLIKKLFTSRIKNEKKVLIENEFGEISVDSSFLKNSGVEIKEINAGCICCSLVGDFTQSIKEIVSKFNPDRIIIEPSGVGKLSDIINAIKKSEIEELELNMLVTVVDGSKSKLYLKNFGEFFLDQVAAANTIVISKLDKVKGNTDDVLRIIKEKNEHANIITTPIETMDSDALLSILEEKTSAHESFVKEAMCEAHEHHHEEECCCHHEHEHHHEEECCHHHEHEHHHEEECCCHHEHEHHHEEECCHHHEHEHHHEEECCCHHEHGHHHADEIFVSWGKETTKSVSYDELNEFLDTLTRDESLGIVVRSKGVLKASDNEKWYYFDFVSGDYEIRLGEPDYTGRIVVIGSNLDESKINSLFFKE